jgi:hypothetical protein
MCTTAGGTPTQWRRGWLSYLHMQGPMSDALARVPEIKLSLDVARTESRNLSLTLAVVLKVWGATPRGGGLERGGAAYFPTDKN